MNNYDFLLSADNSLNRPLYQSYRIGTTNGFMYAGEYPGDRDIEIAKNKIKQLLDFGIRSFVDLTEEGELCPYRQLLPEGINYLRFPIIDQFIPNSLESVQLLLTQIEEMQKQNGPVYVHCWGGVGRTGTIVGCLLAHFMKHPSLETVLTSLRSQFNMMPKSSYRITPENEIQEGFIRIYIDNCCNN